MLQSAVIRPLSRLKSNLSWLLNRRSRWKGQENIKCRSPGPPSAIPHGCHLHASREHQLIYTCEFRTTRALDWSLHQQKNRNSNESPKFKFQYSLTCCFLFYLWLSWIGTWNPRNQGLSMYSNNSSLTPELLPLYFLPWPPRLSGGLPFELVPTLSWLLSDLGNWLVDFLPVCTWLNFWTDPWLQWLCLISQLWIKCMNTLDPSPSLWHTPGMGSLLSLFFF